MLSLVVCVLTAQSSSVPLSVTEAGNDRWHFHLAMKWVNVVTEDVMLLNAVDKLKGVANLKPADVEKLVGIKPLYDSVRDRGIRRRLWNINMGYEDADRDTIGLLNTKAEMVYWVRPVKYELHSLPRIVGVAWFADGSFRIFRAHLTY